MIPNDSLCHAIQIVRELKQVPNMTQETSAWYAKRLLETQVEQDTLLEMQQMDDSQLFNYLQLALKNQRECAEYGPEEYDQLFKIILGLHLLFVFM